MRKSRLTKLIAVVLALTLTFASFGAVTASASSAYPIISGGSNNAIGVILSDIVETLLNFIANLLSGLFPDGPGFVPDSELDNTDKISKNFYSGTGNEFKTSADADAQWHLGYSNTSLIPHDYSNGTYFLGGYIAIENGFSNVVEGIVNIKGVQDDMKARCVAISDGTGRGDVLFATIDCIGITNADIKDIRERLAEYAEANNIVSINISSTHTHSCIDTEGLWTKTLSKLASNGLNSAFGTGEELVQGTNPAYMEFLKDKVTNALIEAHANMEPGVLTHATKDIGQDYFQNKNRPQDKTRPGAGEIVFELDENGNLVDSGKAQIAMTDLDRLTFYPDNADSTKTMMINIAAHPDVAGLPTESNSGREISGDYLFYCGKFLEDAGYNFMFFQGAIAAIYMARGVTGDNLPTDHRAEESMRFGYELARMALSLDKTMEEVIADPVINNNADEIAENTELVSIYDENGNIKKEFKDFGLSTAYYTEIGLVGADDTIAVYKINEDDNADNDFAFDVDTEDNTVAIKSGKYTVVENAYDEELTINHLISSGIVAVTNDSDEIEAIYIDEAIADAALNETDVTYDVSANDNQLLAIDMTDRTYEAEEQKLVLTNTKKPIMGELMPVNPGYSVWYEDWNKDDDGNDVVCEEVEVEPFLNLLVAQVEVPVSNGLIEAIGKLNMANYVVISHRDCTCPEDCACLDKDTCSEDCTCLEDGKCSRAVTYSTVTEIGYMELGNQFKTVFLPGEICQDIVAPNGRTVLAKYSVTAKPFVTKSGLTSAASIFGDDVKCFGLMNDAIGYVVPDNDYTLGDPVNHYQELISLGEGVASALIDGLAELAESIVRV